jgi:hypothetical protein
MTFNAYDGPLMAFGLLLVITGSGMTAQGRILGGLPALALGGCA